MNIKDEIKKFLHNFQIEIVGFGRIPENLQALEIKENLPRVIVFGYPLSKDVLATVTDRPSLIYKHHYKTVNWILDQTACHLVHFIEKKQKRALAIPASQIVDWEHRRGHIPHIILAREAGLGYIGRNGLIIHPIFGAQVRYVSVLTDLDYNPDSKIDKTCGDCHKCIDVCPAGAIDEKGVDIIRCFEKLKEFAKIRGIGQHICGICVKVCDGRD